jgi:hypothetical protein
MVKRYAALVAQVIGVACVAGSVGVWWRPEPAVVLVGVALVVGGALNEVDA